MKFSPSVSSSFVCFVCLLVAVVTRRPLVRTRCSACTTELRARGVDCLRSQHGNASGRRTVQRHASDIARTLWSADSGLMFTNQNSPPPPAVPASTRMLAYSVL